MLKNWRTFCFVLLPLILFVPDAGALDLIQKEHPDLVLLDLLMPKMTGFDVLREVKKGGRTRETPMLIMSGVFKKDVMDFLQASGVAGFIDKDQIQDSLLFRVSQILPAS